MEFKEQRIHYSLTTGKNNFYIYRKKSQNKTFEINYLSDREQKCQLFLRDI